MPALARASWLDGFLSADPVVAAVLIGALVVLSIAFVVLRLRRARGRES